MGADHHEAKDHAPPRLEPGPGVLGVVGPGSLVGRQHDHYRLWSQGKDTENFLGSCQSLRGSESTVPLAVHPQACSMHHATYP